MTSAKIVLVVSLLFCVQQGINALDCTGNKLKVTVKISDPAQFDQYEQYLFQGTLAYAVRKYCGSNNNICSKPGILSTTDTSNVKLSDITDRFAMCVAVDDCDKNEIENAIRFSKPRFNGALVLTDDTLVVEGIPPTLKPKTVPDFPTWLIPFIVIVCLVVLAAIAIIGYTVYQSKKKGDKMIDDDDDSESLADGSQNAGSYSNELVYENGDAATAL